MHALQIYLQEQLELESLTQCARYLALVLPIRSAWYEVSVGGGGDRLPSFSFALPPRHKSRWLVYWKQWLVQFLLTDEQKTNHSIIWLSENTPRKDYFDSRNILVMMCIAVTALLRRKTFPSVRPGRVTVCETYGVRLGTGFILQVLVPRIDGRVRAAAGDHVPRGLHEAWRGARCVTVVASNARCSA
jgi:hypothetical protein